MRRTLLVLLLATLSTPAAAIVTRHDVDEGRYRLAHAPEFLVDMHMEGHGMLIHPRWILTVGHAIFHDYRGMEIAVAGQKRKIVRVIRHPDYRDPPPELMKGHSAPLMAFFHDRSDVALVELDAPIVGVEPVALFRGDEKGERFMLIGRGATGDGQQGERPDTKKERILRQCENQIEETDGNWLIYRFDAPGKALPLEGMSGSGDSGGPALIYRNGRPFLAGMSSWQYWYGQIADFKVGGKYGTRVYLVRVSRFRDWIESTIGAKLP